MKRCALNFVSSWICFAALGVVAMLPLPSVAPEDGEWRAYSR